MTHARKRRVSSGREGGWTLLLWIAFTVFLGRHILSVSEPDFKTLHSYEAYLKDCTVHQQDAQGKPVRFPRILVAMKSTCPITGPNIKSVDTFEFRPVRGKTEQALCENLNQYEGKIIKLYYAPDAEYVTTVLPNEYSYYGWQIDYLGMPLVTYDSQREAWHIDHRMARYWFILIFCVPAFLGTIGYIFKIRPLYLHRET